MTLQNPDHQFLGSTPRDDLLWGLRQHKICGCDARKRIDEVFQQLQIEELADRGLRTLSFGQRRLVALASALVTRPQLLLCDEMTSGLDPLNKGRVIEAMAQLQRYGTTVVWATHDLEHLPAPIDSIAILKGGRLHFTGAIGEGLTPEVLANADLIAANHHHSSSLFGTSPLPDTSRDNP